MKPSFLPSFLCIILLISTISCRDDDAETLQAEIEARTCNVDNSNFKQLYQNILDTYQQSYEIDDFDIEVHGYTFEVASNKQICSIGYQSFNTAISYKIEIIDNADNSQVYYGEHTFSSTEMSYVQLSSPINLNPNTTYTIKRTHDTWTGIGEVVGKILRLNWNQLLPYTLGDLTILSGGVQDVLYNNGSPYNEVPSIVPNIDIVFLE